MCIAGMDAPVVFFTISGMIESTSPEPWLMKACNNRSSMT
jgi:hypothetical protein